MGLVVIVVLEGPDCAGKSTLAAELVLAGGRIVANGRPPAVGQLVDHYAGQILAAARRPNDLTVFDRLHVGELIYGPLFRGRSALDSTQMRRLEQQLDDVRALKLHVDCSDATLTQRYRTRGDALIKSEEVLLENASAYRQLLGAGGSYSGWKRVDTGAEGVEAASLLERPPAQRFARTVPCQ
jgi:thymidylate kinase